MRRPAQVKPWMRLEELGVWVREAATRDAYRRRLAIWLTVIGPFHARQVATMLQVSEQAVWLWVSQYNQKGPEGLVREGRGGRRWSYLSWAQEQALLEEFAARASRGELLTAKQMYPRVEEVAGRETSLDYVYRLLSRHQWRKLSPRPRHVKADAQKQEGFKKKSRN